MADSFWDEFDELQALQQAVLKREGKADKKRWPTKWPEDPRYLGPSEPPKKPKRKARTKKPKTKNWRIQPVWQLDGTIEDSLRRGREATDARMNKLAREFAEDMEPWQWEEYKKGTAGPSYDKKKGEFVWARIPGKDPDLPLLKRGVSRKERNYRTSRATRLERSAADVFSKGGIPGMGIFLGMAGPAARRSSAAAGRAVTRLTKNQELYLPGNSKAVFDELQDAAKLTGEEAKKAKNLLANYTTETGRAAKSFDELTPQQSHLIVHQVKTGKKIRPEARVRESKTRQKEFADEQGKGAEVNEAERKRRALEAADRRKKEEAARRYLDKPDKTKFEEVRKREQLADDYEKAVDQEFGLQETAKARREMAPEPKAPTPTDSFQGVAPPPAAPTRGRPRTDRVTIGDRDLTPQQADAELRGMIGGTPGSGKQPRTDGFPARNLNPDFQAESLSRSRAAQGLADAQAAEAAKVAAQTARAEVKAAKTVDELLDQATRRAKPPKANASLEELEDWVTLRTEVSQNIRRKLDALENVDPVQAEKVRNALKTFETQTLPNVRARMEPLKQARQKEQWAREADIEWFNNLHKSQKSALFKAFQNDVDKVFEHIRKLRKAQEPTNPRMASDWRSGARTVPDDELGTPGAEFWSPGGTSARQAAANLLGSSGALETAGRGTMQSLRGAIPAYMQTARDLGAAAKRNPTKATMVTVPAAGAAFYAADKHFDERRKEREAKAKEAAELKAAEAEGAQAANLAAGDWAGTNIPQEAAIAAANFSQGFWNQDISAWAPEARNWIVTNYLRKYEPEHFDNWSNYDDQDKLDVTNSVAPIIRDRINASPKLQERMRSKAGPAPAAPPRAGEAWVPTARESQIQTDMATSIPAGAQ